MGTVVKDIFDGVESTVQTALSFTAANKLRHVFDLSMNEFRTIKDSYGLVRQTGSEVSGVTRVYTMDHDYQLILTARVIKRMDDDDVQEAIDLLYNRADEVYKALINTKAGVPSKVLAVFGQSWGEPELLDENSLVLLRVGFTIKFRQALT